MGGASRPPGVVARGVLRARPDPDRRLAQLAARDDRGQAAADDPSPAERADRGHRAAAAAPRADTRNADVAERARRRPYPGAVCAPRVADRLVRHPRGQLLRLGAARHVAAADRARVADRRGPALLVAARLRPARSARSARVPRGRLRRVVVPRPGAHLLEPPALLVL